MIQHATKFVWRMETVILVATLFLLLLTLSRRDPNGRVFGFFSSCVSFLPLLVSDGCGSKEQSVEWSETGALSSIYSMQGRRPDNEDRAAHRTVSCPWEGVRPVHIFTVLDGHGGHFAADWVIDHLLEALEKRIRQLKLLTSTGSRSERLKQYEEHSQTAPECVLKFLKITKTEAEEKRESSEKEEKGSDDGE